ncbi:MAG: FAD-dependent oxidoreductase [Bacteroidota bacterium]
MSETVHILGGGLAGLTAAYYARRHGHEPIVYEAAPEAGGNARTLRFEDVLVDTGAHRLHDKDPGATAAFRDLLGDAMQRVEAPSEIRYRGRGIAFPLRPLDAARNLGLGTLLRVSAEILPRLLRSQQEPETFRDLALSRYGPTLARAFLLGYSEKLWGVPTERLDASVAGGRLQGLTLGTFLRELSSARTATAHLDGAFYYPTHGFGMLAEALTEAIGEERVRTSTPVTQVEHEGEHIVAVQAGGERQAAQTQTVVSTLPLPLLVHLLDPAPPDAVHDAAAALRYRNVRLLVVQLGTPQVSPHASLYVPDPEVPFTRLYEPKNRSAAMAPRTRTALVAEVPCDEHDDLWALPDDLFAARLLPDVRRVAAPLGAVLSTHSVRLPNAYPVLEVGHREAVATLRDYADGFENLTLAGRAGTFRYLHTHDLFVEAAAWADALGSAPSEFPLAPWSLEHPPEVVTPRAT